jgi:hypothetical protein
MKRLNPVTGLPFKMGDIREDGLVFWGYINSFIKNGFFYESWMTPEKLENCRTAGNKRKEKHVRTNWGRAVRLFNGAVTRSKKHNRVVEINAEWIAQKLEKGICDLTGLPFSLELRGKTHVNPYAPSLDRIDSNDGYTKTNTRVVLAAANTALGQHGTEVMLPILKAMVKTIEKNAKKNTTAPVSTGPDREGQDHALDGFVLATGAWQDHDDLDDYRGATQGQNSYRSAKEGR